MRNSAGHGRVQVRSRRSGSRSRAGHGDGFRAGQSPSGLASGKAFQFSKEGLAGFVAGTLSSSCVFSLKDSWRSRSKPSRPFSLGQSGACLILRIALQDALSE